MSGPDYAPDREVVSFMPGSDTAVLNGEEMPLPAPAVVVDGSLYAPLITVAEASGAYLVPNAAEQSVTIRHRGRDLKLWLNRCGALLDGEPIRVAAPLLVHKGNVMIPAELAVQYLDAAKSVNPLSGAVTLHFPADPE